MQTPKKKKSIVDFQLGSLSQSHSAHYPGRNGFPDAKWTKGLTRNHTSNFAGGHFSDLNLSSLLFTRLDHCIQSLSDFGGRVPPGSALRKLSSRTSNPSRKATPLPMRGTSADGPPCYRGLPRLRRRQMTPLPPSIPLYFPLHHLRH